VSETRVLSPVLHKNQPQPLATLMRRKVVVIHLGMTSALLGGLAMLFRYGDRAQDRSLYHTVHLTALSVAVGSVYYGLFELLRAFAPAAWGLARRAPADPQHAYASVESERTPLAPVDDAPTEPPAPRPRERMRLTMNSVWGLVYDLGCVFFVALYCASGQQSVCSYFFGVGLACLTPEELMRPLRAGGHAWRQRMLEVLAVLAACISLVLISIRAANLDNTPIDLETIDLFSILFAVVLPVLAPFMLAMIKHQNAYCVSDMMELCEFGLPFMFILGWFFVIMADERYVHLYNRTFTPLFHVENTTITLPSSLFNLTTQGTLSNATASALGSIMQDFTLVAPVVLLAPLLGLPALLFITTATLREHVSDPLISLALVIAGGTILDGGLQVLGEPICLCALVAAKLGVFSRIASASYEDLPRATIDSTTDAC